MPSTCQDEMTLAISLASQHSIPGLAAELPALVQQ